MRNSMKTIVRYINMHNQTVYGIVETTGATIPIPEKNSPVRLNGVPCNVQMILTDVRPDAIVVTVLVAHVRDDWREFFDMPNEVTS